ncbi:temperature dependent protein affecting M2 dsRNA replication-domain-containing protein [Lasiosphaeria ovina]|uniref:Temperature dependent protein affecting M2 dsRNA replication-domain-containing protein n=1 Tax=Lasiosphaeria ovina TaxID=92902 RepID=A0AAE0JS60_9PEZI|nr:temperature dependent protein affecting M2 dsRNA replication-domain-containing protein [Lasiosphaeria ovina]
MQLPICFQNQNQSPADRSVRATKGQHKALEQLDQAVDTPKRRGKKGKKAAPEPEEPEEEVIPCVCGATEQDEDSGEPWIACDQCGAWQHNICMERPWEARRRAYEEEKTEKKKRGPKKGANKKRTSESKEESTPAPQKLKENKSTAGQKRKTLHGSQDKEAKKMRKISETQALPVQSYTAPDDMPAKITELPEAREDIEVEMREMHREPFGGNLLDFENAIESKFWENQAPSPQYGVINKDLIPILPLLGHTIQASHATSAGTMGLYVKLDGRPSEVFGLSCRHVVVPCNNAWLSDQDSYNGDLDKQQRLPVTLGRLRTKEEHTQRVRSGCAAGAQRVRRAECRTLAKLQGCMPTREWCPAAHKQKASQAHTQSARSRHAFGTQLTCIQPFSISDAVNMLRMSEKSVAIICTTFHDIIKTHDAGWLDKYRRARMAVSHFIYIAESGEVKVHDYERLTGDNHEYLGLQLPSELFHYLNTGLIGPRILSWITHGQLQVLPTVDGYASDEYKKLVSTQLVPIKEAALGLLIPRLHRGIGHKDITMRVWYDRNFTYTAWNNHDQANFGGQVATWSVDESTIKALYPGFVHGSVGSEVLSLKKPEFVAQTFLGPKEKLKGLQSAEMIKALGELNHLCGVSNKKPAMRLLHWAMRKRHSSYSHKVLSMPGGGVASVLAVSRVMAHVLPAVWCILGDDFEYQGEVVLVASQAHIMLLLLASRRLLATSKTSGSRNSSVVYVPVPGAALANATAADEERSALIVLRLVSSFWVDSQKLSQVIQEFSSSFLHFRKSFQNTVALVTPLLITRWFDRYPGEFVQLSTRCRSAVTTGPPQVSIVTERQQTPTGAATTLPASSPVRTRPVIVYRVVFLA